jgi:uncharacterized repeat protein (TIGR03803 family)
LRVVISVWMCALIVGCASQRVMPLASGTLPNPDATISLAAKPDYRVLHRFGPWHSQAWGSGLLTAVDGELYGSAAFQSVPYVCDKSKVPSEEKVYAPFNRALAGRSDLPCTSLFKMKSDGSLSIIHDFKDDSNGFRPNAPLTQLDGKLYGSAQSTKYGVVFAISQAGEERVLYQFKGGSDGGGPVSPLTAFNGSFYGMTGNWGDMTCNGGLGCGTVYKVTPSRRGSYSESVLHRFAGGRDAMGVGGGELNFAELDGTLYQATVWGGGGKGCGDFGCGTIFRIAPSGAYRVIYRFKSIDGGAYPNALYALDGKLYGFAAVGGPYGCGTLFSLAPSGVFHTIYAFKGGADGCAPQGPIIYYRGNFYAVTTAAQIKGKVCHECGTIFEISPSGHERVLYEITNQQDGIGPEGLTLPNGMRSFYGPTMWGGRNACGKIAPTGCGVIFELTL